MSEKHTPYTSAPWTTEGGWIYGNPLDGEGGESCVIAQIHTGPDCARAEHTDANSRLIVAAVNSYGKHCGERAVECAEADLLGELLEACRNAKEVFDQWDGKPGKAELMSTNPGKGT